MNAEGTGPGRNHADYWWCYLAAQRGFMVEEIAAELPNVSERRASASRIEIRGTSPRRRRMAPQRRRGKSRTIESFR